MLAKGFIELSCLCMPNTQYPSVAQLVEALRHDRKVVGSIPDVAVVFFIDIIPPAAL
jgi:hypothetical protein